MADKNTLIAREARQSLRGGFTMWPLLLLFFSLAVLLLIGDRAPIHLKGRFHDVALEGEFHNYYNGVVDGSIMGPYVYRVLVPFMVHWIESVIPMSEPIAIDFILKLMILTGLQLALFSYFRIFLGLMSSFAGVFLFDALAGYALTFIAGPSVVETGDLLNSALLVGVLWSLHHRRLAFMSIFLFLGILNRETMFVALVPITIMVRHEKDNPAWLAVFSVIMAVPYLAVRFLRGGGREFDWFTFDYLGRNIPGLVDGNMAFVAMGHVHMLFLIGPLVILVLWNRRDLPLLLRASLWIVPILVVVHYFVGFIIEARLWLPVLVALIPPAMLNLERIMDPKNHLI